MQCISVLFTNHIVDNVQTRTNYLWRASLFILENPTLYMLREYWHQTAKFINKDKPTHKYHNYKTNERQIDQLK